MLLKDIRSFIWKITPKLHKVNTYILENPSYIEQKVLINENYLIRELSWDDKNELKKFHNIRNPESFEKKIIPRLNAKEWIGLAVFDIHTGDIAYVAWVINASIRYFEEFGIFLKTGHFLLKDGYCLPKYRHQGLHTRMEQERINFCIKSGASHIFIQIHNTNKKGIESVTQNGYILYQQNYVLQWPIFNIYRAFIGFLKKPLRRVIK